ncbi:type 1 glutamine amidotransferase [Roseobacter sinensis]|uniref:Type 1 glutamine amidotransferase n=1 Tax=Roseobacter sinensis TaxID=2931391 RepID=A0ABT3BB74_9RHOB|nr:type 1 glutamine amidotransferase [Roseobacter sp. WL0113]MCV3270419.1 type 1 glutamine amidotransferase [Roseobacter sp. WL0113]
MKIGILMTGHPPDTLLEDGLYDTYFERLLDGHGFGFEGWPVCDGIFPDTVEAADGWLITGSKHGAYEDHDWIPPLEDFIRAAHAARRPMIGVCFGHQIIAQAMGGRVEKFAGGWAIGRTEYNIAGQTMAVNAWHQDQVVMKPDSAEVFASNAFCENAGLVYGDRMWTIQPHPEYGSDFIDGLIRTRGKALVPPALLEDACQRLDQPTDRMAVADMMAAFFKKERA